MSNNGEKIFFYTLTMGPPALPNPQSGATCQGITYDANKFESTLLIRSNIEAFKKVNTGYNTIPNDAFLFVIND